MIIKKVIHYLKQGPHKILTLVFFIREKIPNSYLIVF